MLLVGLLLLWGENMAYNKIVYGSTVLIDLTGDSVSADKLLTGSTCHGADGEVINGGMPNKGAVTGTIATKAGTYTIPAGYHNGSGSVAISGVEQAKIIAGNIKNGVTLLGVTGTYSGEGVQTQTKEATPSTSQQTITPDAGKYLSSVTVKAIPYAEADNAAGGKTVTIG